MRRQIRDAEREIEFSKRRIDEIGRDLARRVPTAGDAFAMTVVEKHYDERKSAGRALMTEILTLLQLQQEGQTAIASIGGFALVFEGERTGRHGFRYATLLLRTGFSDEVDLPVTVTPLGAVARLEHALEGFDEERDRIRAKQKDAERRLESYRGRQATPFAFSEELAAKRRELAEVEASLSRDVDMPLGAVKAA